MRPSWRIHLWGLLLLINSCKEAPKNTAVMESKKMETNAYTIPENWIVSRVNKAKQKLMTTEAGQVVWKAMEAQGGLDTWYRNGYLSFHFDYQPIDGSTRRNTFETVDPWNNRVRHTAVNDATASFGWDGKEAWVMAKDSTTFEYDTKFWALTPLYLMGYPFILDGEGVQLTLLDQKEYKGKMQEVVKVTFAANVGDAPDDYYVLYFDAETHLITATRYIVSYPQYFPNGGHSPEKIMEVVGLQETSGILLPTGLKTHWLTEDEEMGEYITKIDIDNVAFSKEVSENFFSKPEGN